MNREERRWRKKQDARSPKEEGGQKKRKVKTKWIGPFLITQLVGPIEKDRVSRVLQQVSMYVMQSYLEKMRTYDAPFPLNTLNADSRSFKSMATSIHNLVKEIGDTFPDANPFRWKVCHEKTIFTIHILRVKEGYTDILVNVTDVFDGISQFIFYRDDPSWEAITGSAISIFAGENRSEVERIANFMGSSEINDANMLVLTEKCMKLLLENPEPDEVDAVSSDTELMTLKSFLRFRGYRNIYRMVAQLAEIPGVVDQYTDYLSKLEVYNEISGERPDDEWPLVDFSDKEVDFIGKYIKGKGYFVPGEDQTPINLVEYLEHPRYGNKLRLLTTEEGELYCTYKLDLEHDVARFIIVKDVDEKRMATLVIDCINIRNFRTKDIARFATSLDILDYDSIPRSNSEWMSMVPDIMMGTDNTVGVLVGLLAIFVVIADRPKRTIMVKETRQVQRQPKDRKKTQKKKEDPEFVVRRVLMPIREAREYVEAKSKRSTGREVQYTLEEWTRVGHWRRIPGTDRKVYINETTCHRHLELSKKEIHLKL